ncbi:hypothetical protein CULT_2070009 [[Clostridium] ultunense Esp]|nr:hypothetical protein CULT_2070009 [[Clostridium] ultunense Esp]
MILSLRVHAHHTKFTGAAMVISAVNVDALVTFEILLVVYLFPLTTLH